MPKWIHDRADHIRRKNPGMSQSQSFAIATQQAHASGNSPKGYGTPEGRREARAKYDEPARHYTQTADPKTKSAHDNLTSPAREAESNPRRPEMHTKLAGRLPLQEMIAQHLEHARVKVAAVEEKDKEKVKKLVAYEKKEHGHIPTEKEEEAEKKASAETSEIDFHDAGDIEKLASALDEVGDELLKEADSIENGGEAKQGGEQLATQSPTGGKQPYSKDGSKKNQVPVSPPTTAGTKDNKGSSTAMGTDESRAPGGTGAKYPAKGVLKTASQSVRERIEAAKASAAGAGEKTAAQLIAEKIATVENGGESHQGGEQLSNTAPIPMVAGRSLVQNKDGIKNVTKAQAKAPRKAELAQVLSEPAMSRGTDNKVHENLRNATKGGVKIAAAKAYLQKIAEEGCTCGKKGECKHCKLSKAVEAKKSEKASE